jgi:hypothetical protein
MVKAKGIEKCLVSHPNWEYFRLNCAFSSSLTFACNSIVLYLQLIKMGRHLHSKGQQNFPEIVILFSTRCSLCRAAVFKQSITRSLIVTI